VIFPFTATPETAMKHTLRATITALFLSVALPACGPPTVQGAESRYKANQDKLSAIVTRKPQAKAEIDGKVAEFRAEYDKAMKEDTDEKKISALSALSSRMETFINNVEPQAPKTGGANAPSDKLDAKPPPGTPPATPPATTPGGKLDGTPTAPASGGMGTPTAPASGGMGTAPTPTPTPAAPAPTAPAPTAPAGGMGGM